jgi:hypothetical protein
VASSLLLFWVMAPWLKTTRSRLAATVDLQVEGVALRQGPDGTLTIHLDGREETVMASEVDDSRIYQEALRRLPDAASAQIGERYAVWRWRRIRRWYLPIVALLGAVLFVAWKPGSPYVEGAAPHQPAGNPRG